MNRILRNIEWAYQNYPVLFICVVAFGAFIFLITLIILVRKRQHKKWRKQIALEKVLKEPKKRKSSKQKPVKALQKNETEKVSLEGKVSALKKEERPQSDASVVIKPIEKEGFKVEEPQVDYPKAELKVTDKAKIKKSTSLAVQAEKAKSVVVNAPVVITFEPPEIRRGTYPIVVYPQKGTVVRTHRYGNTKRRGYKEESFQKALETAFSIQLEVSGVVRLNTGEHTRPFEPDIALINDSSTNPIRIDIEVDEPYAGLSRKATHCKGEDDLRDAYFADRGWIVIRFSEKQVHEQPNECVAFVASIIQSIDSSIVFTHTFNLDLKGLNEAQWDIVQAQKWEKAKYREKYLNHEFGEVEELVETVDRNFNEQELLEESKVKSSVIGEVEIEEALSFNALNAHPRDKRIAFYPKQHVYTVDGVPFNSATTLINRFFPTFDSYGIAQNLNPANPLYGLSVDEIVDIWNMRGEEAAKLGTDLHTQIEKYYLGQPYRTSPEFKHFQSFQQDHSDLKAYRSEWRIFDEEMQVSGTVDFIAQDGDFFDIYDWKRSKKVVDPYSGNAIEYDTWGNTGLGPLANISDTSYNRYCIQQSIYKYILEKNYGLKIRNMYLIVLHPEYETYYKVRAKYDPVRMLAIMSSH